MLALCLQRPLEWQGMLERYSRAPRCHRTDHSRGVRQELLAPERVRQMATEIQASYVERVRKIAARAETLPREIQELDARIARLP